MAPLVLKWHNFSLAIRIKLSPDAKIVLFVLCIFALIPICELSKFAEKNFEAIVLALAGGLVTGVIKDFKSNKLDVEVADKNLGDKLTAIKQAARGETKPADPAGGGRDGQ